MAFSFKAMAASEFGVASNKLDNLGKDGDMIISDRYTNQSLNRSCAIGCGANHDLVTLDKPPDVRFPRRFAERSADGRLIYIVTCDRFACDTRFETLCQMHGYFGI